MQNGFVPKNLHSRPVGQLWRANEVHRRHNARSFGAMTGEGRILLPQIVRHNGFRSIKEHRQNNPLWPKTIASTDLSWIHQLLQLVQMFRPLPLQYCCFRDACTVPSSPAVHDESGCRRYSEVYESLKFGDLLLL